MGPVQQLHAASAKLPVSARVCRRELTASEPLIALEGAKGEGLTLAKVRYVVLALLATTRADFGTGCRSAGLLAVLATTPGPCLLHTLGVQRVKATLAE